jgi:peptidoglycan/LPS O-acetylase OafA/YrhL
MATTDHKLNHIDQLRGVAILLVILVHVFQSQANIHRLLYSASDFGKIGVQLFFFLSAYTLCLSYSSRKEESVASFYIRRYFRIAPLYYTGIVIYYLVSSATKLNLHMILSHHEVFTIGNVASNILFIHGLVPAANNTIVPGGWSIGTEMIFYLLFPAVYFVYSRLKRISTVVVIPFLMFLAASAFPVILQHFGIQPFSDLFFYYFIVNQLPVFALGMSYYFLEKAGYLSFSKHASLLCFLVFIAGAYIGMYKLANNISLAVFLAGISFSFLFRFFKESRLEIPLLAKIGQLSFSIYIFHFLFAWPLSYRIAELLSGRIYPYLIYLICYLTTLTLSIIVASVSEKLIERPGIELGKRIIRARGGRRTFVGTR